MRAYSLALIWSVLAFTGAAQSAECEKDLDAEAARMRAGKDCAAAYKTFDACLWGSTADVRRGAVVREICEAGFLAKLSPQDLKAYKEKIAACARKYAKQEGTMYRSMDAACAAKAARDSFTRRRARS